MDCNQKTCLNCDKGECDVTLPNMIPKLNADNKECLYYEDQKMHDLLIEQFKSSPSHTSISEKKEELLKLKREARRRTKKKKNK